MLFASLLEKERRGRENRVEDERRDRKGAIGREQPALEDIVCLNQDQHRNENDDPDFSRSLHYVSRNNHAEKKIPISPSIHRLHGNLASNSTGPPVKECGRIFRPRFILRIEIPKRPRDEELPATDSHP
jgi:hypothetical protein